MTVGSSTWIFIPRRNLIQFEDVENGFLYGTPHKLLVFWCHLEGCTRSEGLPSKTGGN